MKMMSEIKSEFGFSAFEEDDDVIKNLNDLLGTEKNYNAIYNLCIV